MAAAAAASPRRQPIALTLDPAALAHSDRGFTGSEDHNLAEDLIQAYEDGDDEALKACSHKQHFSFLENEVRYLARAARTPPHLPTF